MTNKDKALIIVNKLFEMAEKDMEVRFTGHCGELVVDFISGNEDGWHAHIDNFKPYTDQLTQIIQAVHDAETKQENE